MSRGTRRCDDADGSCSQRCFDALAPLSPMEWFARAHFKLLELVDDSRSRVSVAIELLIRSGLLSHGSFDGRDNDVSCPWRCQSVPSDLDELDPLGFLAHRHTRHPLEVGLLLHAP